MPSEKILNEKKAIVTALADKIKNANACVLVDYCGLSVQEDTDLRRQLRAAGIEYAVVKNTLTRFAMKEAGYDDKFDECLNGTTAMAISTDDVVAPAKIICKFASTNDKLKVKAGFIEGEYADAAEITALSKVPSKEELISKMLYCFMSPVQGLAIALQAIADKNSEAVAE